MQLSTRQLNKKKIFDLLFLISYQVIILIPMLLRVFTGLNPFKNIIGLIISYILIYSPLFFKNIKVKTYILLLSPLYFISLIYIGYFYEYKILMPIGAWQAIIYTTIRESYEYLLSLDTYILLFGLFSVIFFLIILFFTINYRFNLANRRNLILFLGFSILLGIDYISIGFSHRSYPISFILEIKEVIDGNVQKQEMARLSASFTFKAQRNNKEIPEKEVYIVIIGESARKDKWHAFGYKRNTTPQIEKLENIIYFENANSPTNFTEYFFERSFYPLLIDEHTITKSIVSVFKELGFQTYWLSNQGKYGKKNNIISLISDETCSARYTNIDWHHVSYDQKILPHLDSILSDDYNKKFLVIHLMGSHDSYALRYPPSFNYFNDRAFNDKRFDEYDNSIRYTDYVLNEIILRVSKLNIASSIIYLSDHGEILGDDGTNIWGHGGGKITKYEKEIPFLIWNSEEYIHSFPDKIKSLTQKNKIDLNTGNLFHIMAGWIDARFDLYKPEKDFLFNTQQ